MNTRARFAAALVCVAALVASGCSDDDAGAKNDKTTTTTTTTPGYVTLPAVAVGEPSPLGENLFATVTKVEAVELKAKGPGDVAGPGVLVTLDIRNDTTLNVNLDLIAVNASYGAGTPASPNRGAPGPTLSGNLAPGATKTGRYGYRVPQGETGKIVIDIQLSSAPNIVVVDASV